MAKQRGHGEGSVYQRKDKRWVASITLENRKRKYICGDTRKEVLDKLKVALHEQQQGTLATGPQQTVKQFFEHWLEEIHKPTIRISTYIKYRGLLKNHIVPRLGNVQISKLTPQDVQALYTRKVKEGLSPKTVKVIHAVLHRGLSHAMRWGQVSRNICDVVSLPRQTKYEIQPLTKEQSQKLLEVVRGHRLEGLLIAALTTGMRRGELLALRWQDVHFDDKSIEVRRTVDRVAGYGFVVNEPKTASGIRRIVMPKFVIASLKEHRRAQLETRLQAGEMWKDNDLVFCNITGGFLDPSKLNKRFNVLLKEAGLAHIRFHDLRHSVASILLTMGVHPKVVQELLGHSQISMTLDIYSHILPSMQQDAMDKLDGLFSDDDEHNENGQAK